MPPEIKSIHCGCDIDRYFSFSGQYPELVFFLYMPHQAAFALDLIEHSPAGSQTGPARRGDNQMISKHLELLKNAGNLSEYYKMFSDDISSTYKKS